MTAPDAPDPLTTLRAEVAALRDENWSEVDGYGKRDEYGAEQRAIGRARMAQTVLDLIDKARADRLNQGT